MQIQFLSLGQKKRRCTQCAFILFGIALVLIACASPASPPETLPVTAPPPATKITVEPAKPSDTPDAPPSTPPSPTATLIPFTETPENTPVPLVEIEPFIAPEGLHVRFSSWSPDGQWIAYWLAEDQESPASLSFASVVSGETCQAEEVQAESTGSDLLHWQEDGSVFVLPGSFPEGALKGAPCGAFAPAEEEKETLPDPRTSASRSPDGRYLAEERIIQQEEAIFHIELKITELATGQSLLAMPYLGSPHLVWGGPKWLDNDTYVIGRTFDQGTLYYSVSEDRVGQLYPDLLGLVPEKDFSFFTQTNLNAGTFHLLVLSDGPPLLYHSEFNQLEELPFAYVGSFADASGGLSYFSLDGKWLLLYQILGGRYWLRPVDPPGSTSTELAYYGVVSGLSPDGQKLAFNHSTRYINIVRFPEWELLNRWDPLGYDVSHPWWSPDSRRLVTWGIHPSTGQEALFVIEP